jgi:lipopolysaccharide/colanic/teichoic acid biosynthesis glycosyltransferase
VLNMSPPRMPTGPFQDALPRLDEMPGSEVLAERDFRRILCLERKRTERSHRRFVLMLLEADCLLRTNPKNRELDQIIVSLAGSTRETDVTGWYKESAILGVIFTEIGVSEGGTVAGALLKKVTKALSETLSIEQINEIKLSFHIFPEAHGDRNGESPTDSPLYPELDSDGPKTVSRLVKRLMDVTGGLAALLAFSPLLVAIAVAIKLTSKGSIVFRQERIGEGGKRFTFLKFRSMHSANDPTIHQEYVRDLIAGAPQQENALDGRPPVFKLTNDPRVTVVGRVLRRTSLDELPQFVNVIRGEMSLVGPRPPVPYEFECYDIWHRRRLLSVKPGITGMWQVGGRSKVKFDDMVRLDLQYARSWSPWLDVKILLQTPRAVLSREGAY